jgi:hypothetical protein
MRMPSDTELIAIWEHAAGEHPIDRALTLLSACSEESPDELARLSIGSRDARLLEMHEHLFGPSIEAFAKCPACSEPLEYNLSTHDLRPSTLHQPEVLNLDDGNISLRLRLPDSFDLRAIRMCGNAAVGGRLLMERCVVEARIDDEPVTSVALPEQIFEAIASRLAVADPQAEILIDLACSSCRHQWQVVFDIERFLWSKISALSQRLLREVHALASAYGWSEPDILALSPMRRQTYVEMAWPTF